LTTLILLASRFRLLKFEFIADSDRPALVKWCVSVFQTNLSTESSVGDLFSQQLWGDGKLNNKQCLIMACWAFFNFRKRNYRASVFHERLSSPRQK